MQVLLSLPLDRAAAFANWRSVADGLVVEIAAAQEASAIGTISGAGSFVSIRPLDAGGEADIAAAMPARPSAIVLPGVVGAADVQRLGVALAVHEAELGLADGATGIVAIGADTAGGVLALGNLPGASPRLAGIAIDEVALGLGDEPALRGTARSLTILSARAAGVPSLLMPAPGYDAAALRRLGFSAVVVGSAAEALALRTG